MLGVGSAYVPGWAELRPFVGEVWLVGTIVGILASAFWGVKGRAVAAAGLVMALVGVLVVGPGHAEGMRGFLVADGLGYVWSVLLLVMSIGVVGMSQEAEAEFYVVLVGAVLGMSLMGKTSNLLMIYMGTEMASLPSYVLAGFRKSKRAGAEAAMKYVLFGAASTGVMVYGLSLLYGIYGTLQLGEMSMSGMGLLAAIGVGGLVVGVGFKIAAAPFHLWCPDVFEGAGVEVAAFLSVASKGAGIILLLRVLMLMEADGSVLAAVIGVMGAITCTVGNTAALVQQNVKRMLAYSSIAQAGYILCAMSLPIDEAKSVVMVYLVVYLFMNLGAFAVVEMVSRSGGKESLAGFRGLARRSPIGALAMAGCLVSLVGVPPMAGFLAKVNVLWALGKAGGWSWALVGVIVVNTVVSAFYYFKIIRAMYFQEGEGGKMRGGWLASVCGVILVGMFLGFEWMVKWIEMYLG